MAREKYFDNKPFYYKHCNKWWDGYTGQEYVLIDDFGLKHDVLAHHLKLWGDRYGTSGEIKGGMIALRHQLLVVTS
jgi:hypothetical protein